MVVCLCNQITDYQLRESIKSGISTVKELRHKLGVGEHCGCCAATAKKYLDGHSCSGNCRLCPRKDAA